MEPVWGYKTIAALSPSIDDWLLNERSLWWDLAEQEKYAADHGFTIEEAEEHYLSQSLYIQAALGNGADKIAAKHTVFLGKATLPKHCVVD